jgi:predicted RNA polymerase sigma factor
MALPAFQSLIDSHGPDVHRFLVAQVGSSDAEDCYQETWIAALRAYPRLAHGENLRGWVLTIAGRKAIAVPPRHPGPRATHGKRSGICRSSSAQQSRCATRLTTTTR